MIHSFNVEVAKVAGILPATIFNTLGYWVETNRVNGRNCFDGRAWTYNTVSAWCDYFPYATRKQIEKALARLRDAGLVETGNYNEDKRDRTLWYTLTDLGLAIHRGYTVEEAVSCISPEGDSHFPKKGNDYINTVGNPVKEQDPFPQLADDVIDYLNLKTGKMFRKSSKATRSLIHARSSEGYTLEDFKYVIDVKCAQWLNDPRMDRYLQPSTLFGTKFENYANERRTSAQASMDADIAAYMAEWPVEHRGE